MTNSTHVRVPKRHQWFPLGRRSRFWININAWQVFGSHRGAVGRASCKLPQDRITIVQWNNELDFMTMWSCKAIRSAWRGLKYQRIVTGCFNNNSSHYRLVFISDGDVYNICGIEVLLNDGTMFKDFYWYTIDSGIHNTNAMSVYASLQQHQQYQCEWRAETGDPHDNEFDQAALTTRLVHSSQPPTEEILQ